MRSLLIAALLLLAVPARATTLIVALAEANNSPYEYLDANERFKISGRLPEPHEFE